MYLLRALGVVLSTIIHATVSVALSFFDPTGVKPHRVAQRWAKSLLWIGGVTVDVNGGERIDPNGSYIIVSNHLSYYDTPVVLASIPVQFRFMAKEELFKIPFLGTHLGRAGHVPVPQNDPRAAIRAMSRAGDIIREKHISVLVFPEGGRSENGELQEFRDGAAYIGIKAGVPIVPIALCGTRKILPMHSGEIKPGHVTIRVGQPIETASLSMKDRARITVEIRDQIVRMLDEYAVTAHS